MRPRRRIAALAVVLAVLLPLVGCGPTPQAPTTSRTPTASVTPHIFTVATTQAPQSYDPAAADTGASAIIALNVFQRLMIVHAGDGALKPDAATDCLFTSPTVYECQLQKGLTFTNGTSLTASDVKFSIERAYRLNSKDTSIRLLNSLQKVEQVDDYTIRFHLKFADTQFGYALAAPAASIVEETSYNPDAVRPNSSTPIGSGPYSLAAQGDTGLTFAINPTYRGATAGSIDKIRLALLADSPSVEQAMADGSVDAVWRSLDASAITRIEAEMAANSGRTKQGMTRVSMSGVRMQRLSWNPDSKYLLRADLRTAVAQSLQADRTLGSLIPPAIAGAVSSFPVGGRPTVAPVQGDRINLTLGYPAKAPGEADLARLLRDRLENNGGFSVQLRPDATDTDLLLTDRSVWLNTALGWLQTYLDEPLPGSQAKLADLDQSTRITSDPNTRKALLGEIQQQAASDLTVLPISLGDETFFLGKGVSLSGDPYGPGWQLGLWSFRS